MWNIEILRIKLIIVLIKYWDIKFLNKLSKLYTKKARINNYIRIINVTHREDIVAQIEIKLLWFFK